MHRMRRLIDSKALRGALCVLLAILWLGPAVAQDAAPPVFDEPVAEVEVDAGFAGEDVELGEEALLDEAGEESEDEATGALDYTLMELIGFGGIVGYIIIGLSFVAVALMVDDALLLRRKVLMPPSEIDELRGLIAEGNFDAVAESPRASYIGAMVAAGAQEHDVGYDAVVKGMEDCADGLTGRLLRRIEYLNIIANITPMLGLLGTVIGMVNCFNQISVAAGGVDPRLLAGGIFQALMTTVMGLIVAIPTMFVFSLFRNRVDALAAEAAQCAEDITTPLRPRAQAGGRVAQLSSAAG